MIGSLGQRVGVRTKIETYTEVVCANRSAAQKDRPDGLIVVRTGSREWRALVEAKVGSTELDAEQIEKYRLLAKENDIDCVISISNQFATTPSNHPVLEVNKSRSKIPVSGVWPLSNAPTGVARTRPSSSVLASPRC